MGKKGRKWLKSVGQKRASVRASEWASERASGHRRTDTRRGPEEEKDGKRGRRKMLDESGRRSHRNAARAEAEGPEGTRLRRQRRQPGRQRGGSVAEEWACAGVRRKGCRCRKRRDGRREGGAVGGRHGGLRNGRESAAKEAGPSSRQTRMAIPTRGRKERRRNKASCENRRERGSVRTKTAA